METRNFKNLMIALSLATASSFFTGCDKDDDDANNNTYTISGNANGAQMVPTVAGTGTGTITGTYNSQNNTLTYTTNWNGLTGAPTTGNFYTGATGVNGTAIGTAWTFAGGTTATGSRTGTLVLTDAQETQLLNGQWYYTYGTATNPNGEVRGQITAVR